MTHHQHPPTHPGARSRRRAPLRALGLAAVLLLPFATAGCGTGSAADDSGGAKSGGTLVIGATGKLPNPDTVIGGAGFEGKRLVSFQLYEGLTRYDLSRADGPAPITAALATSWKVADDDRT